MPFRPLVELGNFNLTLCPISYDTPSGKIRIRPLTLDFDRFFFLSLRFERELFFRYFFGRIVFLADEILGFQEASLSCGRQKTRFLIR